MSEILLSVVVPSYNSEDYIEECLKSIERETTSGVEFVLIDGASTDATMEIVNRYAHLFAHVVSEPDRGQSHAFNKGFGLAKGRYLTWLNSDDIICPGAMSQALSYLLHAKGDWLAANTMYLNDRGQVTRCCRSGGFEHFAVRHGLLNVFGPSTFFTKSLFEEVGEFSEDYHYCMDTEYWWRIVMAGYVYERIPVYFWGLRLHSDAKTANVLLTGVYPPGMSDEVSRMARRYYPSVNASQKSRAVLLLRLTRVLNLSYIYSTIDTFRFRGR